MARTLLTVLCAECAALLFRADLSLAGDGQGMTELAFAHLEEGCAEHPQATGLLLLADRSLDPDIVSAFPVTAGGGEGLVFGRAAPGGRAQPSRPDEAERSSGGYLLTGPDGARLVREMEEQASAGGPLVPELSEDDLEDDPGTGEAPSARKSNLYVKTGPFAGLHVARQVRCGVCGKKRRVREARGVWKALDRCDSCPWNGQEKEVP